MIESHHFFSVCLCRYNFRFRSVFDPATGGEQARVLLFSVFTPVQPLEGSKRFFDLAIIQSQRDETTCRAGRIAKEGALTFERVPLSCHDVARRTQHKYT